MGIIKAVMSAVGGGLADQWLEVIEADDMGEHTVFTSGVAVRKNDSRRANKKATADTVSNGSVIHVYPNQFMLLVDGGKIVDYTAEEGYYTVDTSSMPSLFGGEFGEALTESFNRVRYGGVTPGAQKVFFINLQEIKGIKFGTRNPVNYFDNMYGAELFLRAHGTYSVKIVDPIRFYAEAVPRNKTKVDFEEIADQYFSEFMQALQAAINQMSADGERISFVASKGPQLSKYMSDILDEDWRQARGIEVQSVGIASISYDEASQKLIGMRNEGAMLSDPSVREGYVQGAMARGVEKAGSNPGGAGTGFFGVGMGMQAGAGMAGTFSQANQAQRKENESKDVWVCSCGSSNPQQSKFCGNCGKEKALPGEWKCPQCGKVNDKNFCGDCGTRKPDEKKCPHCGKALADETQKFCPECGNALS